MCSATGFEYWSGMRELDHVDLMPVSCSQTGPEKLRGSSACRPDLVGHVEVTPANCLAACTARIGGAVGRPFGRGLHRQRPAPCRAACRRIGEIDRRLRQRQLRQAGSAPPDRASMPVACPNLLMKVRRVGSPRSQASTSAARPASKSRFVRDRSLLLPPLSRGSLSAYRDRASERPSVLACRVVPLPDRQADIHTVPYLAPSGKRRWLSVPAPINRNALRDRRAGASRLRSQAPSC